MLGVNLNHHRYEKSHLIGNLYSRVNIMYVIFMNCRNTDCMKVYIGKSDDMIKCQIEILTGMNYRVSYWEDNEIVVDIFRFSKGLRL